MTGRQAVQVTEYRPGRNFIRVGDVVHVRHRKRGRRGFDGRVRRIFADPSTGEALLVDVEHDGVYPVEPDRIRRRAQTRGGEKVAR